MKSKFATALVALALVLTGCGASTSDPSPSASIPAEAALTEWVTSVGLRDSLKDLTASLSALSTDLNAVDTADTKALADAIAKHGPELQQIAVDIAAEKASDDATYEALRASAAFSIRAFAKLAIALSSAAEADRLKGVTDAITALSPMNAALKPLSEYISAHGTDTVHPGA